MVKNVEQIAARLGAKVVCQVPDVGGGVFGMSRLAGIIQGLRSRRLPTPEPEWAHHPEIPMTRATQEALEKLAEMASTPERKVSPIQLAAQLLEQTVAQVLQESGAQ